MDAKAVSKDCQDKSPFSLVKSIDNYIGYCRTEEDISTLTFTWEIANFWDIYQLQLPIYTGIINSEDVQFQLNTDKEKQNLYLYLMSTHKYVGICHVFLKNNEPNFYETINMTDKIIYICSIPIILLLKNTTKYLPNNTLTIYIKCEWYNNVSQKTMYTTISKSYNTSSENIKETDLDKESLVTFIIGDKRLYANKNLICAKSTVFQAMFHCEMKEGITNEVKITDVKYDVLKLLLSYIKVCFIPDHIDNVDTLSDLFIAADKYDLQDLKTLCELLLMTLINVENYLELLAKICLYNTKYLEKYILKFIQIQPKDIFKQELLKLIETSTNSACCHHIMKYTEIQIILSCDTKTSSSSSKIQVYKSTSLQDIKSTSESSSQTTNQISRPYYLDHIPGEY
ncbi:TD and POZ domain-containing protein 1-like [Odontomachus brunneus]|uniref:TD and POZ domain-containing protein 1-like n=1 Tax=Odontomachus brunneus TaxID=486640 RepID=UPI0013F26823|nr:TD and POZ domain-containing protein 1-like [Odontomachus brunneus]